MKVDLSKVLLDPKGREQHNPLWQPPAGTTPEQLQNIKPDPLTLGDALLVALIKSNGNNAKGTDKELIRAKKARGRLGQKLCLEGEVDFDTDELTIIIQDVSEVHNGMMIVMIERLMGLDTSGDPKPDDKH